MTAVPDLAAWLRQEIQADLAAARIIGAGGFAPQRWDTDPPGQVNPDAMPGSSQVNATLIPDPEDREFREFLPGWVQVVAWDRLNNEPPEKDCRDDDLPVILVQDGRRQFAHIIRQDPRSTVARCEAELAILGEHKPVDVPGMAWRGCATCKDSVTRWPKTHPCRTVRLLGSGYKHRDGYLEEWAP